MDPASEQSLVQRDRDRRRGRLTRAALSRVTGHIDERRSRRPEDPPPTPHLAAAADLRAWDAVRIAVLGRNGSLTGMLRDLGKTPPEQRKDRGAALNRLKDALTAAIEARKTALEDAALDARLLPSASTPPCRRARARPA